MSLKYFNWLCGINFPPDVFVSSDGRRASHRLFQASVEEFWQRFIAEYVPPLTSGKNGCHRNFKVGDLVQWRTHGGGGGSWGQTPPLH